MDGRRRKSEWLGSFREHIENETKIIGRKQRRKKSKRVNRKKMSKNYTRTGRSI